MSEEILLSNKKELIIDSCSIVDEHQKCLPEQKKPDKKRIHTVWFNLYETLEKTSLIYGDRNHISGCLEMGINSGIDWEGTQGHFLRWIKYSISWLWWWLNDYLHFSKSIKL